MRCQGFFWFTRFRDSDLPPFADDVAPELVVSAGQVGDPEWQQGVGALPCPVPSAATQAQAAATARGHVMSTSGVIPTAYDRLKLRAAAAYGSFSAASAVSATETS